MENKCGKCGGDLAGRQGKPGLGVGEFIPLCDEKKLKRRRLKVICDTCVECGNIENICVENPETLK